MHNYINWSLPISHGHEYHCNLKTRKIKKREGCWTYHHPEQESQGDLECKGQVGIDMDLLHDQWQPHLTPMPTQPPPEIRRLIITIRTIIPSYYSSCPKTARENKKKLWEDLIAFSALTLLAGCRELVSWSLTSLFSTNMAISETIWVSGTASTL